MQEEEDLRLQINDAEVVREFCLKVASIFAIFRVVDNTIASPLKGYAKGIDWKSLATTAGDVLGKEMVCRDYDIVAERTRNLVKLYEKYFNLSSDLKTICNGAPVYVWPYKRDLTGTGGGSAYFEYTPGCYHRYDCMGENDIFVELLKYSRSISDITERISYIRDASFSGRFWDWIKNTSLNTFKGDLKKRLYWCKDYLTKRKPSEYYPADFFLL